MGMYYHRLMESAVQDPNNPGNDIEQIAKDIEDNEANKSEIEYATEVEGIGDPIEEAYNIMYESTYNYNQLLRCIGVVELQEAVYGREYILEAVDIRGFFEKVKKILVKMFEAITKAFKNVWNRMVTACNSDKKLVEKHGKEIRAGYASDWSYEGWKFPDEIKYECKSIAMSMPTECSKILSQLKTPIDSNDDPDPRNFVMTAAEEATSHKTIIKRNTGLDAEDAAEMKKGMQKKYYGGEEKIKFGKDGSPYPGGVEAVIKVLSGSKETDAIKKAYGELKNSYKDATNAVKEIEKRISANEYGKNISKALSVCEKFSSAIVYEKNVQNTVYTTLMAAAKAKRSQSRRLALMWQRAGYNKGTTVQHNSTSMFSSITLA